MGNEYGEWVFLGFMLVISVLAFIFTNSTAKNTITEYLQERGAKDIMVNREWFDFDRDTKTFFVEFTHPNGNKVSTRCKLYHWGMFVDGEIFWSEPTKLESLKTKTKQLAIHRSEYHELSVRIRSRFNKKLPTYEISTVLPITNTADKIVMLKYVDSFNNVLRCKDDGTVIWQAELPTVSGDVYTNIAWQENRLTAFSRSCIAVTIDTETGNILSPKSTS